MPRFYFNVYDGRSGLDMDGTELPDWHTARLEAIRLSGEIMKDEAHRIIAGADWRIEVTDHRGLIVFQMTFSMSPSTFKQNTDLDQDDVR